MAQRHGLTTCGICDTVISLARHHCPTCGSQRVIRCSHSYEPYRATVHARNVDTGREVVRAIRSDWRFRFITAK